MRTSLGIRATPLAMRCATLSFCEFKQLLPATFLAAVVIELAIFSPASKAASPPPPGQPLAADVLTVSVSDPEGKPVREFRVLAGTPSGSVTSEHFVKRTGEEATNWQPHTTHIGSNGVYAWSLKPTYDKWEEKGTSLWEEKGTSLGEEKGTSLILLPWATRTAQGEAEAQAVGRLLYPLGVAPGPTPLNALAQCRNGFARQRPIDTLDPIRRSTHRPRAQRQVLRPLAPPPQPAPLPRLGARHQLRAAWVGFDVSAEREKMLIALDRKAFEPALIQVPPAAAMIVLVVSPHVGHADPAQPASQRFIRPGPHDQVPVVRHDAVGQQINGVSLESLGEHAFEGGIVLCFMKQPHATVPTVEHVINETGFDGAGSARHAGSLTAPRPLCQRNQ